MLGCSNRSNREKDKGYVTSLLKWVYIININIRIYMSLHVTVSKLLTLSGHRVTWCCTSDLSIKCLALNGQLTKSLSGWFLRHFKRWCWKRLALILCTSSNGQIINSSGSQRDHSSGADQAIYATESKNKRQHFFEVEETAEFHRGQRRKVYVV